ncbi:hypothetical protein KEM52_002132 [Ascosphaera acerosa]|nr:hypothetical protein KEM52_002132 [Ascosphaera acerosa]
MSKSEREQPVTEKEEEEEEEEEDDQPDEWDQRIMDTGCQAEQLRMNDCYYDSRDWRKCTEEACHPPPASPYVMLHDTSRRLTGPTRARLQVLAFRECWKRNGNNERTDARNA